MMGPSLFAYPSDNRTPAATITAIAGTVNAAYPPSNLGIKNPRKPAKFTGTSGTWRFTWSGNEIFVAWVLINHNLGGATVTLTNGAGLNRSIAIPAYGADGICFHAWDNFSGLSVGTRTDDVWDLAITGAAQPIAVGEVLALAALRDMGWKYPVSTDVRYLVVRHPTFGGAHLTHNKRIRIRSARSSVNRFLDLDILKLLNQNAVGSVNPFFFALDSTQNDPWLAEFVEDRFGWAHRGPAHAEIGIAVQEVSSGPPLFA